MFPSTFTSSLIAMVPVLLVQPFTGKTVFTGRLLGILALRVFPLTRPSLPLCFLSHGHMNCDRNVSFGAGLPMIY